jgi:hypothetical protein
MRWHEHHDAQELTLPTKICAACQRPFACRKKWERAWDNVKFCSDRCRAIGDKEAHLTLNGRI